jgi:kynureninase
VRLPFPPLPLVTDADPLLAFREAFPILARSTYLVSNSLGAMPRTVPDRLAEYARLWNERGVRAWADGWWRMPATVGDVVAPLLGAAAGEVVMVPTVTQALSGVLSALDYPAGRNRVVMTALDFPSVRYAFDALAPRFGAEVVVVPSDDGVGVPVERLLAAIDERTRLVAISHVFFRSAFIVDAAAIIRRAHEVGALVALDAYHSVGVIPVDVHALGVDFLAGGVLKWLCGGPGGAFLYVAPSVRDRYAPALTGWQAHRTPFAFAPDMTYADGIWRWLGGTPAVPALFAGLDGPQLVHAAGIDALRAKSIRQTSRLLELADARGWRTTAPREAAQRGGTVAFDVPHAADVAQALLARDIVIDYRPGAGIRVAPHFYTTDAEVDVVADAIDDILATEAWRPFAGRERTVT